MFETLREQVPLQRLVSANGSGKARCVAPDHSDSSPSMHLYGDHAHCFGCGFHGDVVDVWAATRGLRPGVEAALDLAREFGIELPEAGPEARQKAQERREREDRCLELARACHRALERHERVREWWKSRGFGEELRERFLLGANRDGTEAVIPFWSGGRVQGLIRRKLEGEPKYRYPRAEDFPGGRRPLFVPGRTGPGAFVVEGILDALALAAAGESAIATGGTSMSAQQRQELERIPAPVYILPDADRSGERAGREWARQLYPAARLCPAGYGGNNKDFADLFAAEGAERARQKLEELKSRSRDALDVALDETPEGSDRERYRYAREHVLPLLLRTCDVGERSAALRDVARVLSLKFRDLQGALKALERESNSEREEREAGEGRAPRPEPPDGAELLDRLAAFVRRFVALTEDQAQLIALWIAHTHAFEAADTTPYLNVKSAEKRSGKTRLLEVLSLLAANPWLTGRVTSAVLVRKVAAERPALLLDESDAAFKADREYAETLRGVLNAGFRRGGVASLCVGQGAGITYEDFPVFSPKAIAGIGKLPDTVADRSIPIELRRRRPSERVERFRLRKVAPEAAPLQEQAASWAGAHLEKLATLEPELPEELDDRAQDIIEPLLAIADVAGGRWPEQARKAAVSLLTGEEREDAESLGVRLLRDIRTIFEEKQTDRLPTGELLHALHRMDEAPWGSLRGEELDARGLARLLKPYGVKPEQLRVDGGKTRGYRRAAFEDAWERYVPDPGRSGTSGTSGTNTMHSGQNPRIYAENGESEGVPDSVPDVPDVPVHGDYAVHHAVRSNPHTYGENSDSVPDVPDVPDNPVHGSRKNSHGVDPARVRRVLDVDSGRTRRALEAFKTPRSGAAINLKHFLAGELEDEEVLTRSVLRTLSEPEHDWEEWCAPVLAAVNELRWEL